MKLIIAIVQDEDSSKLLSKLMQQGFGVTKLATTGGFLKAGNTTLLLGVDEERIEEAIHIVESVCKSRKQMTAAATAVSGITHGEYTTYPVEVTVGGATLFVLSVDQFLKV
ncbi:MAG: cyclic-di-AMP receptor [Clostridiales bacterium]|nr:cyclic-di-AMP receptor [Clostridiales bacterium]